MTDIGWNVLKHRPRFNVTELLPDQIPDGPGVYVWWRDDQPQYVDCARRLRVRLTRIDTTVAGHSRRRSTLRSRVRLLLRKEPQVFNSPDDGDRVDAWLKKCSVSWLSTSTREEAEGATFDLLEDRQLPLHVWRPRQGEDEWLLDYLQGLGGPERAGKVYVEVPIGGADRYGPGAKTRFIDAVRLPNVRPGGIAYYHQRPFEADISAQAAEIIEVKKTLNRTVIGQLVVAEDLARAEWPSTGGVRLVALCTRGDPALEWICEERGIDVEVVGVR